MVALCLGALVGLERQVAEGESGGSKDFPGVRTFAFTGLLGALSVLVSGALTPWMGIAIFVATTCFLVLRYRHDVVAHGDPGYTTETAALCTFVVGALAQADQMLVATIVTIAMAALLRYKRVLHKTGALLAPKDMEALIRFLVITGIVLPLLPSEPLEILYGVLRPRDVWRMVVLLSGLSFVAYVLMRFRRGPRTVLLNGLLAGFVSSTAAMLVYAGAGSRTERSHVYETMAALAASTSFLRILVMLAIVAPSLALDLLPPLVTMCGVGLVLALLRYRREDLSPEEGYEMQNPLELKLALSFGAIYAGVLVLVAAAQDFFGGAAVYGVSVLAAVVGADAPTLSLARLSLDGRLEPETAALGILTVAVTSTLAKGCLMAASGRPGFALRLAPNLGAIAFAGAAHAWWTWGLSVSA